jgi:hypothetical protein
VSGPGAREGSTEQLLRLCAGYFAFYAVYGVAVKWFKSEAYRSPPVGEFEFLYWSTLGAAGLVLVMIFAFGWFRLPSNRIVRWGPLRFSSELAYIAPSGVCTGIIIPTTTLMYTLPISVMVAMVIMRGSVIVISRLVDAVQIRQGILKKRVYGEENWAVVFALLAVSVNLFWEDAGRVDFSFARSPAALAILSSYVVAYAVRIYLMNYYKNTRAAGVKQDNRAFFALEQLAATATLVVALVVVLNAPTWFGWEDERIDQLSRAVSDVDLACVLGGFPFGLVAFFSVFLFMFQGRTATFAGLVNRLTSLLAGTAATVISALAFGEKMPKASEWVSVGFIAVAVAFLTRAERRRSREAGRA